MKKIQLMKAKNLILLFTLLFGGLQFLIAQTEIFEDLLDHHIGFGQNVTGGKGGTVITLGSNDFNAFVAAVEGIGPRWVRFEPGNYRIFISRNVHLTSDLTIDGRGANVVFTNGNSVNAEFQAVNQQNIIIHNVTLDSMGIGDNAGGGLNFFNGTHDVWIDHVTFHHLGDEGVAFGYDEFFDPEPDSNTGKNVTLSYCKWYDTPKALLLGWHSQAANKDKDILITVYHCYFTEGVSRIPNQRGGKVHFFNNVVENWGWSAIEQNNGSELLAENNWFGSGSSPAMKNFGYGTGYGYFGPAWTCDINNAGNPDHDGPGFICDSVFQASDYYSYTMMDPGVDMKNVVIDRAGRHASPLWDSVPAVLYKLTTEIVSGIGTITPDSGTFYQNEVVTIVARDTLGYKFFEWGGDISGTENPVSFMMDTSKHVTASFNQIPTYTLSVSVNGNGQVTPDTGVYNQGDTVTLLATTSTGYKFSGWEGDVNDTVNPLKIVMDRNFNITANFIEYNSLLAYWTMDETSGTMLHDSSGNNNAVLNNSDSLTFVDGKLNGAVYFNGSRNAIITATSIKPLSLTVAAYVKLPSGTTGPRMVTAHGDNFGFIVNRFDKGGVTFFIYDGSGWPSVSSTNSILDGKWHHIAATFNNSNKVATIYVDGVLEASNSLASSINYVKGNDYYIGRHISINDWNFKGTIDQLQLYDQVLNLEDIQNMLIISYYTLSIHSENGTVSSSPEQQQYKEGTEVSLTAVPASGYQFDSWSGNASGTDNPINITMDSNKEITAVFSLVTTSILEHQVHQTLLIKPIPNPMTDHTMIGYRVLDNARVILSVHDISGIEVSRLVDEFKPAGSYSINWNGCDFNGNSLSKGIYFVRLKTGSGVFTRKVILVR